MVIPALKTTTTLGLIFHHYWLVKEPSLASLQADFNAAVTEIVFDKTIAPNVSIRARVDGLFELELSGLENCGAVQIPELALKEGEKISSEYRRAEKQAYQNLISRLKFVNAFKACFTSAMSQVQGHAMPIELPELPMNYVPLKGQETFNQGVTFGANVMLDRKLTANYQELRNLKDNQLPYRTVVTDKTLAFAAEQFEAITKLGENFALLVDLLYHQHYLHSCHRFSESLLSAWSITETCLNQLWETFLSQRLESGIQISRERKKKLTGRDFTASIIQETLNLSDILSTDEYTEISKIRKARNDWVHGLKSTSSEEAADALRLCRSMIEKTYGIDLLLNISHGYTMS
jgi:hypothetical protein